MASSHSLHLFPTIEPIILDDFTLPELVESPGDARRYREVAQDYRGLSDETSRQVARILHDLRIAAGQRDQALKVARDESRRSFRPLVLLAAEKDGGTPEHCLRVGAIGALIAREMAIPQGWCDLLFDAAAVHDIGKISVPDGILTKLGGLSEPEQVRLERHTITGAKLLATSSAPHFKLAAEIALNHHERWDGSGYPARRRGEDIPQAARITAVADFIDCAAWPADDTLPIPMPHIFDLLELSKGSQFDPAIVDAAQRLRPDLERIHRLAHRHALQMHSADSYSMWWRTT